MIDGVTIKPLKRIADDRGCVMKMQEASDPEFKGFGEVYFSTIYPGVVKGWHMHPYTWLNYACVSGMIKLVLWDGRENSPTAEEVMEIALGERDYKLVQIPPGVWNGFACVGGEEAMVCDLTDRTHDDDVIERLDPHDNPLIPYDWTRRDR